MIEDTLCCLIIALVAGNMSSAQGPCTGKVESPLAQALPGPAALLAFESLSRLGLNCSMYNK